MQTRVTSSSAADFYRSRFGTDCETLARAPGRVEFIGNHTDYNGGLVAGAAIDRHVFAAAGRRSDRRVCFASAFSPRTVSREPGDFRRFEGEDAWADYPLGVLAAAQRRGLEPCGGFNLAIVSDLPPGAGLSSSAALELAAALSLGALRGRSLSPEELVELGRAAENDFIGLPSGALDQTVCAHGRKDRLVFIDCRRLTVELAPLPAGYCIVIFNTGVNHSLVDSLYSERHRECAEALRLLQAAHPNLEYLVDAPESALEALPQDAPAAVLRRARHVIRENARVAAARDALRQNRRARLGELLRESHESSRTLFENSCPELDTLAALLNDHPRVCGARLSGGGFGGAVLALVSGEFGDDDARSIRDRYETAHGRRPGFLRCRVTDGATLLEPPSDG